MKYELIKNENNKKIILITNKNEKEVIKKLTYELWLKYIQKAKYMKVKYKYNYSDFQTIEFIVSGQDLLSLTVFKSRTRKYRLYFLVWDFLLQKSFMLQP